MRHRVWISLVIATMALGALLTQAIDASGAATPIQFSGDLDGSYVSQTVVGVQGHPVPAPTVGALQWDGGAYYWAPAGVSPGLAGQALWTNDAGAATVWAYPHGDVDASATDPGALTVTGLQGRAVSSSAPTTGNTLSWNGTSWLPRALDLSGGSGYVVNTLPAANQAAQTMTGDVTGTTAANTVTQAQGGAVTFTSGTTPVIQSSSTATSLTLGTNTAGATLALQADAATTAMVLSAASGHARAVVGNQGSDTQATLGPDASSPTIYSDLWLLNHGGAPSGTNWTIQSDGTSTTKINAPSPTGVQFYEAGSIYGAISNYSGSTGALWLGNIGLSASNATLTGNGTTVVVNLNTTSGVTTINGTADIAKTLDFDQVAAPGAPTAKVRVYTDSADGKLKAIDPSGNIFVLAP